MSNEEPGAPEQEQASTPDALALPLARLTCDPITWEVLRQVLAKLPPPAAGADPLRSLLEAQSILGAMAYGCRNYTSPSLPRQRHRFVRLAACALACLRDLDLDQLANTALEQAGYSPDTCGACTLDPDCPNGHNPGKLNCPAVCVQPDGSLVLLPGYRQRTSDDLDPGCS